MPWATRIGIILFVLLGCWLLMGWSIMSAEEEKESAEEEVLEERLDAVSLYERGLERLSAGQFDDAIEDFEQVEREFPASIYAKRAQIMAGYAAYRSESFDEAALILERFVKLHPNNENTPYAYYLRALTFYDQIVDVGRDQKTTERARQALREVVSRYPDSD